jgi:hypothetical protein
MEAWATSIRWTAAHWPRQEYSMEEEEEQLQVLAVSSRSLDNTAWAFTALTAHLVQQLLE